MSVQQSFSSHFPAKVFASRAKTALKSKLTGEKSSSPWLRFQVISLTCTRRGFIYSAISSQVFTHSGANTFALLSVRPLWPPSSSVGANRRLFVVRKPPRRDKSPQEMSTPRTFWWVKTYEPKNLLVSLNNGTRFGQNCKICSTVRSYQTGISG